MRPRAIFMTGATGYVGSYVTEWLLRNTDHELALLVRTPDYDAGVECLWRALQPHMEADELHRRLERICFISGDLAEARSGHLHGRLRLARLGRRAPRLASAGFQPIHAYEEALRAHGP